MPEQYETESWPTWEPGQWLAKQPDWPEDVDSWRHLYQQEFPVGYKSQAEIDHEYYQFERHQRKIGRIKARVKARSDATLRRLNS